MALAVRYRLRTLMSSALCGLPISVNVGTLFAALTAFNPKRAALAIVGGSQLRQFRHFPLGKRFAMPSFDQDHQFRVCHPASPLISRRAKKRGSPARLCRL